MSESDSSVDSTVTAHPSIRYVDVMSLANEDHEDDDEEQDNPKLASDEATVVLKEEVEMMIQNLLKASEYQKDVLRMLLHVQSTMSS
jgi:hypothetical protein